MILRTYRAEARSRDTSHGHPFLVFDRVGDLHVPLTVAAKEATERTSGKTAQTYLSLFIRGLSGGIAMRRWIFGMVLVFVLGIVVFSSWFYFSIPTYVYLIPKGYHGWVQVLFEVSGAQQPPKQWINKYLIRVPRNGIAITSLKASGAHIETNYVDQNGNLTPILDADDARAKDPKGVYVRYFVSQGYVRYFSSKTVSLPQRDLFFIGTKEEFDRVLHQIGQPDYPPYPLEIKKKYQIY